MKTVVLIDDEHGFRRLLTSLLAAHGWEVFEAQDGEEGIALALQKKPDVVMCDLLMPRCNGFQVCRTLRAQLGPRSSTKIVVTTGSAYATDRLNAFEAGADEYITKPIRADDLVVMLERITSLASSPTESDLEAPLLDPQSGTVVRFWGVRGSISTPGPNTLFYGGNTSCVEVRADGELVILDAGTGIRALGLSLQQEFGSKPFRVTILISHTHWDHIQGFPFFVPAYYPSNEVHLMAFEGARRGLEATLASQMESPYFPISMQQMPGHLAIHELRDLDFKVGTLPVLASFMNHPGVCAGYRLNTRSGCVVYMPDNELLPRNRNVDSVTPEASNFMEERDQRLLDFLRDAEVAIMDAQYDATEYETHAGWGHSCVDDVVDLAVRANVRRLFLFHHDPDHTDAKIAQMLAGARALATALQSSMIIEAAREGMEIRLALPK